MKTLKQFKCKYATIKLQMTEALKNDDFDCLYMVTENPSKKNSDWNGTKYKFWSFKEADEKMLQLIQFWFS